jgi:hypothetical protein
MSSFPSSHFNFALNRLIFLQLHEDGRPYEGVLRRQRPSTLAHRSEV